MWLSAQLQHWLTCNTSAMNRRFTVFVIERRTNITCPEKSKATCPAILAIYDVVDKVGTIALPTALSVEPTASRSRSRSRKASVKSKLHPLIRATALWCSPRDVVFASLNIKLQNGTRERPATLTVKVDIGAQGNVFRGVHSDESSKMHNSSDGVQWWTYPAEWNDGDSVYRHHKCVTEIYVRK